MGSKKRKARLQSKPDGKPVKISKITSSLSATTKSTIHPPPSPPSSSNEESSSHPQTLHDVTSTEELEIAVETLQALSEHPNLIKTKPCRDLRTAVHAFRQACTTGVNAVSAAEGSNLTARITAALADEKYTESRILLAEMRIRGEQPKLGALCRWVRDLDIISGLSGGDCDAGGAGRRTEQDNERLLAADSVLRCIGPVDQNPVALQKAASTTVVAGPNKSAPAIHVQDAFNLRSSDAPLQVYASVLDKSILKRAPADLGTALRVIETTPGLQRKPPNHHPALVYTSTPEAVPLDPNPDIAKRIQYHPHPVVPRLGVATNVLSPDECQAIIAAGEAVGFQPDAPIRDDEAGSGETSVLAHNFYWVVDMAFHDTLWARISQHLPAFLNGRAARGINRRFRVYRYVSGAEYRCHIDGAWPPSGVKQEDDSYVYDASPPDKKQSSLFTFLVYLNDDFEGGETTYFLPAASQEGVLNAYPVRPVMGGVAIFPHGEIEGILLHEGTGVRKGAKYVIRTDVEYDVEAGNT